MKQSVFEQAAERDQGACQDCGRAGAEIHHVVAKRLLPGKLKHKRDTLRNLIVLCVGCHFRADTKAARVRHLRFLRDRHGYDYSDWAGFLEEAWLGGSS